MKVADGRPESKSLIAAAGCGKTQLIVDSVAGRTGSCSLVLTHTNAGVGVLVERMRAKPVPSSQYVVETIDGWCLRAVRSYPATAGLRIDDAADGLPPWSLVHAAAARVIERTFFQKVVRTTYHLVYVDEYQDCSLDCLATIRMAGLRQLDWPVSRAVGKS